MSAGDALSAFYLLAAVAAWLLMLPGSMKQAQTNRMPRPWMDVAVLFVALVLNVGIAFVWPTLLLFWWLDRQERGG